jgi:hypothetical protein
MALRSSFLRRTWAVQLDDLGGVERVQLTLECAVRRT